MINQTDLTELAARPEYFADRMTDLQIDQVIAGFVSVRQIREWYT